MENKSLPSAKELKKLADACRKAGIKSFKGYGIEFTLTDDAPVSPYKRKQEARPTIPSSPYADKPYESDTLSEDALMFWSVGTMDESDPAKEPA